MKQVCEFLNGLVRPLVGEFPIGFDAKQAYLVAYSGAANPGCKPAFQPAFLDAPTKPITPRLPGQSVLWNRVRDSVGQAIRLSRRRRRIACATLALTPIAGTKNRSERVIFMSHTLRLASGTAPGLSPLRTVARFASDCDLSKQLRLIRAATGASYREKYSCWPVLKIGAEIP